MQAYFDPQRENDDFALPDLEIFYMSDEDIRSSGENSCWYDEETREFLPPGWYYWACLPGCLPDSDPIGPFDTEENALQDAQLDQEEE